MKKLLLLFALFATTAKAGNSMSWQGSYAVPIAPGGIILDNQKGLRFQENTGVGTNYVELKAGAVVTASYSLLWPVAQGAAGTTLVNNGSGALTWDVASSVSLDQQVWVSKNGDDGTAIVGRLDKPFLTLAAAEAAITDATDVKHYAINIGPGDFDVTGMEKKSNIFWLGSGGLVTRISVTTGSFDLANSTMGTDNTYEGFSNLGFDAPLVGNFFAEGGTGSSFYYLINVISTEPITLIGRGGDRDTVFAFSSNFDDGWDLTSINVSTGATRFAGSVNFRCNNTFGGQWLTAGTTILASVLVQDVDNASFCLFGAAGSILGNGLTIDGANAQAYIDSGSVTPPGVVTQTNGGTLTFLSRSDFVSYTPADSGQWSVVPSTVAAALNAIGAGTVRPDSWTVLGPVVVTPDVATDTASVAGLFSSQTHTTVDGSNNAIGLQLSALSSVDTGAYNDKTTGAFIGTVGRSAAPGGDDAGHLDSIVGAQVLLQMSSDPAGLTDKVYGFSSAGIIQHGTITDMYDFYGIGIPAGDATVTNHYGMYLDYAGPLATNEWGVYSKGYPNNWMATGLKIGGSSGSTDKVTGTNMFEVQGTAASFTVGSNGFVGMGTTAPSAPLDVVHEFITPTGGEQFQQLNTAYYEVADTGIKQNTRLQTYMFNPSGTLASVEGLTVTMTKLQDGDVGQAIGIYSRVDNADADATITDAYSIYLAPGVRTGAVTNDYGVYQEDASAKNAFFGNVGIGTTAPTAKLDVVGTTLLEDTGGNGGNVPHARVRRSSATPTSATCAVTCSAGETATGGGCQNSLGLNLVNSYPSADATWSCEYTLATGTCTAWAVCFEY